MAKKQIKPLGDNLLIKLEKPTQKTESGIYLPENSAAERPQEGQVVAIGVAKEIKVKKGQTVIFRKFAGTELKLEGVEYMLIRNEDLLAIIE